MHKKGIQIDDICTPALEGVVQVSGQTDASGLRFGIVVSRFNQSLTEELVRNAIEALTTHGCDSEAITVVWGPGAYELPCLVQKLAKQNTFSALIALGVVIEGETQHAELINFEISRALSEVSRQYDVPVIYEVVSARTLSQAESRCQGGQKSRGWYAGLAAIEMAHVFKQLEE